MTNVHRIPEPNRVEEEASDWIARLHADSVSNEDRERFEAWRQAHPLHGRTYDAMSGAWRAFNATGTLVRAVSFGQSMNQATQPLHPLRRWLFAGTAVAVLLVAAATLYWLRR